MFSAAHNDRLTESSLALRAKLSFIVVSVVVVVMLPFGWFTVADLERAAKEEAVSQVRASNLMLLNMIAANQDGLKIALRNLGRVFFQYYPGTFSLDETTSKRIGDVQAPVLKLGGQPLGLDHRLVNQFSRDTGGSVATVFVRVGDDFLRITTSLTKEDGTPAIGTFLGKEHPGYARVLAGQSFLGQATLFGRQYMTEYIPLRDASQRVIGLLFVGMDLTDSLNSLLDKVRQLSIGKTGYAYVLNTNKGEDFGRFLVHPTKQGKNALSEELVNDSGSTLRDMLEQREGVVFYRWRNEEIGDTTSRLKLAAFAEYRELGWLVASSGYLEDFSRASLDVRNRLVAAIIVVALVAILVLNVALGRWVISPLLRMKDQLVGAGETIRVLINALPDIVCFKDGSGRWLEANKAAREFFRMHGVDLRWERISDPARQTASDQAGLFLASSDDEAVWRNGGISRCEESVLAADGSSRRFEVTRVPVFYEDGRRRGMLVIGHDLSERKKTEEQQRLAARVFETTGEAIMITDTGSRIVLVNPAFCRITGYSAADVLGRTPLILNSGYHDQSFHRAMWETLRSQGSWVGEVWNRRKSGEVFPELQTISSVRDESGQVTHYVSVFADLSEIRNAQAEAEQLSWRDRLTGLANRELFIKQLDQAVVNARRDGGFGVVLLIDLDRFKTINEARGLAVGDALLIAAAKRFGQILHADDTLARLDSDEFAVLLPRLQQTRDSAGRAGLAVAEKLNAVLRESIDLEGEAIHLEASIGIALFPVLAQETASDVLRQADMAMREAKQEGGGQAMFFETEMGESVKARYELERELRLAIDSRQLRLFVQPQVDAAARQVGAEALVRWEHPIRGLISPGVFIPLAEASDLVVAIDRWMLGEVCKLLVRLDRESISLRVAVNVSPRHFNRPDFVDEVRRQIAMSGADPSRLVLEVTEGLVIGNFADAVAKMATLTALGLHFSIDDFGTGYSSLAYLKRLPIHELKIDKSFIDDVPDDVNDVALVETIIAVAQHLNLQIVAEGVENEAQSAFLKTRGVAIYQGYLYGRPEPVEVWLSRLLSGKRPE